MGLDNLIYQRTPVKDDRLTKALKPLTFGFMTDDSWSFRGKVYDNLFEQITSYSLYNTSEMGIEEMDECVQLLTDFIEENKKVPKAKFNYQYGVTLEEVTALRDVFKLCSKEGWLIIEWW